VTDGPVIRALTLVGRDEADQLVAGRELLEAVAVGPEAHRRADQAAEALETLFAGPSGLWDAEDGPGDPGA
jgi:hypothetical protein